MRLCSFALLCRPSLLKRKRRTSVLMEDLLGFRVPLRVSDRSPGQVSLRRDCHVQ